MSIRVIFNPAARSGRSRHMMRWMEHAGAECELKPTSCAGEGRVLASAAVRDGCTAVVAAGGDGTINEVVNGIADVPGGFDRIRLGVLPVGSVNVFARELGLPGRPEEAWRVIQQGRETRLDLPVVEYRKDERTVRQHFVQLAGAGLDARAIEGVTWKWKRRLGPISYILAACRAWRGPHPPIRIDAREGSLTGLLVLVGNGRCYGGRWPVFPDADFQDGLLDVLVFRRLNWLVLIRTLRALASGRVRQLKETDYVRSADLSLRAAEGVPLELDGEAVGRLPAVFKVMPRTLRLLVPERRSNSCNQALVP